jgi:nitrogen regulatory protein PII
MTPVKRIEIVADAVELPALIAALHHARASGWTIIRNIAGAGDRGERGADQPTDVLGNVMLVVACPEQQVSAIVEAVRPILRRFGGMCLVSDALWADH